MGVILSPVLASTGRADFQPKGSLAHWCPGCERLHHFACDEPLNNGAKWTFSGSYELPHFTPSMLITWGSGDGDQLYKVCHYFVRGGVIEYLHDSTHKFRGLLVPMPPIPDEAVLRLESNEASRGERLDSPAS